MNLHQETEINHSIISKNFTPEGGVGFRWNLLPPGAHGTDH